MAEVGTAVETQTWNGAKALVQGVTARAAVGWHGVQGEEAMPALRKVRAAEGFGVTG